MRRLHPLSPVLRGWKFVAGLLAYASSQAGSLLSGGDRPDGSDAGTFTAVLFGGALLGLAFGWLSWRSTRYGFDGGDLRIETGVVRRQSRRIRLDRLQAVDVVRPLLARVLGLAELRLEVAGGSSTEAPLAYLSEDDAHRLRAELLALAAGLQLDTPEAPERPLHSVGSGRLLASSVLQLPVLVGVLVTMVVIGLTMANNGSGALILLLPSALSSLPSFGRQFVANFGFTLAASPDGLRISRGLLETRAQTVPPGRIQAVRLTEPLLWRTLTGWARLEVEIAGYATSGSGSDAGAAVLLPVAPRSECLALLAAVLPGANADAIATSGVPDRARWLAPLSRKVLAVGADDSYFMTRRGALNREIDIMPHERIQSVRVHQGPLQRLFQLASVTLDTPPGPVTVTGEHRDAAEAWRIAQQQAQRARTARSRAVPSEWMTGGYGAGGVPVDEGPPAGG